MPVGEAVSDGRVGRDVVRAPDGGVQFASAMDTEPAVQGLHVDVERVGADAEGAGSLLFAAALEQEPQDLALPARQGQAQRFRDGE
jgi:hypothetical protein